jgi:hypothetical protein
MLLRVRAMENKNNNIYWSHILVCYVILHYSKIQPWVTEVWWSLLMEYEDGTTGSRRLAGLGGWGGERESSI